MTVITLPFPPSLNGLFSNRSGGRNKTARYSRWLADAASALSQQRVEPIKGSRCIVRMFLTPPTEAERDADNYLKAPIDFLVSAGVLEGDSRRFVKGVSSTWTDAPPKKPGALRIELEAA